MNSDDWSNLQLTRASLINYCLELKTIVACSDRVIEHAAMERTSATERATAERTAAIAERADAAAEAVAALRSHKAQPSLSVLGELATRQIEHELSRLTDAHMPNAGHPDIAPDELRDLMRTSIPQV